MFKKKIIDLLKVTPDQTNPNKDNLRVDDRKEKKFCKLDSPKCSYQRFKNSFENEAPVKVNNKFKLKDNESGDKIDLKQSIDIKITYNEKKGNALYNRNNQPILNRDIYQSQRHKDVYQTNASLKLNNINENQDFKNIVNNNQRLEHYSSNLKSDIDLSNLNREIIEWNEQILDKAYQTNEKCEDNKNNELTKTNEKEWSIVSEDQNEIIPERYKELKISDPFKIIEDNKRMKGFNRNKINEDKIDYKYGSINNDESWRKLKITDFIHDEKLIEAEDSNVIALI